MNEEYEENVRKNERCKAVWDKGMEMVDDDLKECVNNLDYGMSQSQAMTFQILRELNLGVR